jgi:hypothetical protein
MTMANYYAKTRTNYFSVTDVEKFKGIIAQCGGADEIVIFDERQEDSSMKYGFFCDGSISGLPDKADDYSADNEEDNDCDYSFDALCKALQSVLPENEAILITEVGYEKMRYLVGICTVITPKDYRCVDIKSESLKLAITMLNNPDFKTKMEY